MFTTKAEEEFFFKEIDKTKRVLEYGSGVSTKEIANKCKNIVSIEHQKYWFDKNKENLPDNCELLYAPPSLDYQEGGECGTYEQFREYVDKPLNIAPFDVILIDGRARIACASICNLLGNKDTIIFVHDFDRAEYQEILKILDIVEIVETMAKFKIKNI